LRNSLLGSARWPKTLVDEALEVAGIDGGRRAETLSVEEYVRLARELQPAGARGD
jgi:16S rRNA A1518/A1519 N6-dimethyltransferase RsmA/KsgA/DIM1 with predicted DNA glycosylase/AP lyase activity